MKSKPDGTPPISSSHHQFTPSRETLVEALALCSASPQLHTELLAIYRRVDQAVAAKGATCLGGGGCCKFDLAGHLLYLSTAELSLLCHAPPPTLTNCRRLRCPYQVGPRCMARERRGLGCRTFFCRQDLDAWSNEVYEDAHNAIRRLHADLGLPYLYVELTVAIATLFDRESYRS
jgi:hypothetical protein